MVLPRSTGVGHNFFMAVMQDPLLISSLAGAIIGYAASSMTIIMLFRPRSAWSLSEGVKIPLTPGLIPGKQKRFAVQIGQAVSQSVLTTEEITMMTRNLVTPENLERAVAGAFARLTTEFKDIQHYQRFMDGLVDYLSGLLGKLGEELPDRLAANPELLSHWLGQLFDRVFLEVQLTDELADLLTASLMETAFRPDALRMQLIRMMDDEALSRINDRLTLNLSGMMFLASKVLSPRLVLERLRAYLVDQPDDANRLLADLMEELGFQEQLSMTLRELSLKQLPYDTLQKLKAELLNSAMLGIRENRNFLAEQLQSDAVKQFLHQQILRLDLMGLPEATIKGVQSAIAGFLGQVLERETEAMVRQLLPLLGIEQIIAGKIERFSPITLERIVVDMCRSELRQMKLFGALLGLALGWLAGFAAWH